MFASVPMLQAQKDNLLSGRIFFKNWQTCDWASARDARELDKWCMVSATSPVTEIGKPPDIGLRLCINQDETSSKPRYWNHSRNKPAVHKTNRFHNNHDAARLEWKYWTIPRRYVVQEPTCLANERAEHLNDVRFAELLRRPNSMPSTVRNSTVKILKKQQKVCITGCGGTTGNILYEPRESDW